MSNRRAFIDCSSHHYERIFRLTSPGKISYCRRMGFDFVHFGFDLKDRTQHWGRILGLRKYITQYDILVYLDTDSVITNRDFDIMDVVDSNPGSLIMTGPQPHEGHIGTNGMIFRNCSWCESLLDYWYSLEQFVDEPYFGTLSRGTDDDGGFSAPPSEWKFYEQSAFHYMYDTRQDVRDNTALLDRKYMHAVPNTHSKSDFIIHFPGMSVERKIRAIKSHLSRLVI
jgi:hypothetical protein